MRETIEQFGSTIVVTVATVLIIGILTGFSIWGVSGLIGAAGYGEAELTKEDNKVFSTSGEALDYQTSVPQVQLTVLQSPDINKPIALIDLIGTTPSTEINLENVYVVRNGAYVDAEDAGLVVLGKNIITFKSPEVYFVEVSLWEENRLSKKMARVNLEEI